MKKVCILILTILALICICAVASADKIGWVREGDYFCYYDENGEKLTGTQTLNGKVYNFTNDGYLKGNGKVQMLSFSDRLVYLGSDNKPKTGWQTVEGYKYYFLPDSAYAVYGNTYNRNPTTINGSDYVFDYNCHLMVNEWFGEYYGDKDGKALNGYNAVDGVYYFFESGKSVYGFQTVNGKLHYFHYGINSGYPEVRGWQAIDSSLY